MKKFLKNFWLIWSRDFKKAALLGLATLVLFLLVFGNKHIEISAFFGLFTGYMYIGFKITEKSKPASGFDFCVYNVKFGALMIAVAIIALISASPITIITWPFILSGVCLIIAPVMGILGIQVANYFHDEC